jgi:hypothetical protein
MNYCTGELSSEPKQQPVVTVTWNYSLTKISKQAQPIKILKSTMITACAKVIVQKGKNIDAVFHFEEFQDNLQCEVLVPCSFNKLCPVNRPANTRTKAIHQF